MFHPGEGWVDLPLAVEALLGQFRAAGGRLHTGTGRAHPLVEEERVTGVVTDSGRTFTGDAVVLAMGAGVPRDLDELGVSLPDGRPISLLLETVPVHVPLRAVLNTRGSRSARRPWELSSWTRRGRRRRSSSTATATTR